jgi:hypothetical protein
MTAGITHRKKVLLTRPPSLWWSMLSTREQTTEDECDGGYGAGGDSEIR